MAQLMYGMLTSLDGYTEDATGNFDFAEPDEDLHAYFNDIDRLVGTHIYGRRMYETMVYWETAHQEPDASEVHLDYARVWQSASKVVYSTTLESVSSERTQLKRTFDPDAVRDMKRTAERAISISGPNLAAAALRAGLVDEIQQYICPVVIGNGTRFLPDDLRLNLELIEERRFASGVVALRYTVKP